MYRVKIEKTYEVDGREWTIVGQTPTTKKDSESSFCGEKLPPMKDLYGYIEKKEKKPVEIFNQEIEELDFKRVICSINGIK